MCCKTGDFVAKIHYQLQCRLERVRGGGGVTKVEVHGKLDLH